MWRKQKSYTLCERVSVGIVDNSKEVSNIKKIEKYGGAHL
jgi:hypothetical protein